MSIFYNPKTIIDGLVLALDAGNIKSYNVGISSTTWTDIIGRGNTGTLTNSPTYSSQNGGSIVFNGATNYVENLAPNLGISGDTSVTLSCWFYNSKTTGNNQALLVYGNGSTGGDSISILLQSLTFYASFNGGLDAVIADNVYALNTWNNVVVTKTPGAINTTTKLYLNGVEQTITSASSSTPSLSSRVVRVARWTADASPFYFLGGVSAALIYNRALSAAEVLQNYNSLKNRFVTAPVLIPVEPPYDISRSVRLNSSDSAYLNRTPSVAGNRKTWTWSAWVKRSALVSGALYNNAMIFSAGASNPGFVLAFDKDSRNDAIQVNFTRGSNAGNLTSALFRDFSAWFHLCLAFDTTQATASDRVKIWINGVQQTWDQNVFPTQNADYEVNNTSIHNIGRASQSSSEYINAYLADVHFIDGQALTPSSFTETNSNTGQLIPKFYSGTYGVNGFRLNFSNNSAATAATLGADSSGNGNNWTPNNLSVTAGAGNDILTDTPTSYGTDLGNGSEVRGNYATLNPLALGGGTLSNGNLTNTTSTSVPAVGTFAMTSGKWYWEVTLTTSSNPRVGVYNIGAAAPADLGGTANGWCLLNGPSRTYNSGSAPSYGAFVGASGSVVMVAYDADAGKIWYGENGSWLASGNPATGANPSQTSVTGSAIVPASSSGTGTNVHDFNFGQRPFAYPAPTGFKCLCDTNLPTPTIAKGSSVFDILTWTGADTGTTRSFTGLNFSPDLVWSKIRSNTYYHTLYDTVRNAGAGKELASNDNIAEGGASSSIYGYLSSFDSNGFTYTRGSAGSGANPDGYAYYDESGSSYVAWAWDAGSSTVTNTAGTISSQVRANASAGFSVVTYTGNATAGTVGHGLGVAPAFYTIKRRSSSENWCTYHSSIGPTGAVFLNQSLNTQTNSVFFNNTSPTSSVFSIGTNNSINGSTSTYVAYCFAPVSGYSSFSSYTGNGSEDGPLVYTGFRPKWILIKRSDLTNDWLLTDSSRLGYNTRNELIWANLSSAELEIVHLDILSNGFKIRTTNPGWNASGGTYIYAAFAENPFQYSRAR